MSIAVVCTWCGESIAVPDDHPDPTVPCPKCGSLCGVPASPSRKPGPRPAPVDDVSTAITRQPKNPPSAAGPREQKSSTAIRAAEPPRPEASGDDEDNKPYGVSDVVLRCPNCAKVLADDAVTCPGCELNLQTGTFPERVFEKIERHWETGLPPDKRWQYFLAYEAGLVVLGLVLFWQLFTLGGMIYYGILISAAAAYVLGTYRELDLNRTERGRVSLTLTWRFAFIRGDTTRIKLGDYEGVASSARVDRGFFEWFILVWLLFSGVLPGILWFLLVFHQPIYQVALTQDHGYPALILYRGYSEEQATHIAQAVGNAWPFPRGSES